MRLRLPPPSIRRCGEAGAKQDEGGGLIPEAPIRFGSSINPY